MGAAKSTADSKRHRAREAILVTIEETPGLSQTALVDIVRESAEVGKGLVLSVLKQLVKEGKVDEQRAERKNTLAYYPG